MPQYSRIPKSICSISIMKSTYPWPLKSLWIMFLQMSNAKKITCHSKRWMTSRSPKSSDEVGHIFSADYRCHYEVMRDSSVATSTAQRRPFLSSISFGRRKRNGQNQVKGVEHPLKYAQLLSKKRRDSKDFVFGALSAIENIFIDKIPVSISDVSSGRLRPEGE